MGKLIGINYDIKRYCELISLINEKHAKLDHEMRTYEIYGHTLEEVYAIDIMEIQLLEEELTNLIKKIQK